MSIVVVRLTEDCRALTICASTLLRAMPTLH